MPKNFFEQFEKMEKMQPPKIIFNQVKNHNERSGVMKKSKQNDANSKAQLIAQLEEVLKLLADVSQSQTEQKGLQFKDPIIEQLQILQKRAIQNDYKEIQKLCMLAIGKRILNIELKKKRQQFEKKQQKKSQIQEFFRQNRIKKFDYDSLVEKKLLENTLIVRPYSNGKGFVQSANDYVNLEDALIECDYINVVRQVNKIFFDIFSGKRKDKQTKLYDLMFKILWIPIAVFLVMIVLLPFYTFQNQQIVLTIIMSLIVVLLTFVTISTYLNVPNSNNQMQQSIQDTKKYFTTLNSENFTKGKQYQWICPENFMYLEVKFDYNIQEKMQNRNHI